MGLTLLRRHDGVDPSSVAGGVRAVLFDVDGTLYSQTALRLLMAAELGLAAVRGGSLGRASQLARVLHTFRCTREGLREEGVSRASLEDLQFDVPAAQLGMNAAEVRRVVDEWIFERPLRHMPRVRRTGLHPLLAALGDRRVRIGALSDYPVASKLDALGVAHHFSLRLCTTDRAINAFKPHPKGFRHACDIWGLAPREVLYVGDRPEVDGAGAAAAGMRCVIVGRRRTGGPAGGGSEALVGAFADLRRAFVGAD
jgi:FMN phosphatase YigB (HAD superfamily)